MAMAASGGSSVLQNASPGAALRQRPQTQATAPAAEATNGGEGGCAEEHCKSRHGKLDKATEVCIAFLQSRPFKCITLAIVSIVPAYGMWGFLPRALEEQGAAFGWRLLNYMLAMWFTVQFLYNFAMSQFTDPGGCKHIMPTHEATGQFEMVFAEGTGPSEPMLYAPNWCEHCRHWKPPRAHHCSMCRRCVLRMDHHCPFTGNCIGMRNHGHFLLMYVFALLGLLYSLTFCVSAILIGSARGNHKNALAFLKNHSMFTGMSGMVTTLVLQVFVHAGMETALQTLFTMVALVAVLVFGTPAVYMACTGQTLLEERFPMKEYVQIKPQVYCPLGAGFYRWGWRQNLRDILGPRWWIRLLLPVRGGPLDPSVALAPRPSPAGAAALLDRVKQVAEQGVQREVRTCQELGINPGPASSTSGNVV